MLRALKHRDYRLFWLGQTLSLMGGWMQTVGQAWLVLELTDSALMLGLLGTLQYLPLLLLSLPAGALADRIGRRWLLMASNFLMLVFALILAELVSSGSVQYWHVALLALASGLAQTVEIPARQSYQFDLVGKPDLMNAMALNSASYNMARIAGPAVAGILIGRLGVAPTFLLNALSFLAVLVALALIRTPGRSPGEHESVLQDVREGLDYARSAPQVRVPLQLLLVVSVFLLNHNTLIPLLARDVLHQGPEGLGWLTAALGVGALSSCLILASGGRHRPSLLALIGSAAALAVA
ncbi:MAG: MFS transporter, partial [Candidatus Eremiobacterota bacterium]